ncbi:MAG: CoA transferase [Caulobacteraceae bacterium]
MLNGIFARKDRADWLARLAQFDLPFAPVNTIAEAAEDEQARHMGMVVPVSGRVEGAHEAIRAAFTVDGVRDQAVGAAPVLDQHGQQIREALARDAAHWPARS